MNFMKWLYSLDSTVTHNYVIICYKMFPELRRMPLLSGACFVEIPNHVTCVASNSAPVMACPTRHAFEKEVNRPRTRRAHKKDEIFLKDERY